MQQRRKVLRKSGVFTPSVVAAFEAAALLASCSSSSATPTDRDISGAKLAEVASDADGCLVFNPSSGTYLLEPQSPGILPLAQPQEVTVEPHGFTEITVPYDSGIR